MGNGMLYQKEQEKLLTMRVVFSYAILIVFLIGTVLTILSVFFRFGSPSEENLKWLMGALVPEMVGLAALIYRALWKGSKNVDLEKYTKSFASLEKELSFLKDKMTYLSRSVEFSCRLLQTQYHDSAKFSKNEFGDKWYDFLYMPKEEFLALSYMNSKHWAEESGRRALAPTKARKETEKHLIARRIFVVDSQEELNDLTEIIEAHICEPAIEVAVIKKEVIEKIKFTDNQFGVTNKNNFSFFVIDGIITVFFEIDEKREVGDFQNATGDTVALNYKTFFLEISSKSTWIKEINIQQNNWWEKIVFEK